MKEILVLPNFIAAAIGAIVTWFFGLILKRRARFIYTVAHSNVGVSTNDPVFGSIEVLYNKVPATNLWLSTLEIINTSLRDFKEVPLDITARNNASLLNETLKVNDTYPSDNYWEENYKQQLSRQEGQEHTDFQINLYNSVRKYKIPVVNRNDKLTFTYLTHTQGGMPELHATINKEGILCKYRSLRNLPLDLYHTIIRAVGIGLMFTIPLLVLTIFMVDDSRYSAITGWILGFSTGTLGLVFCWAWNKLRISLFN